MSRELSLTLCPDCDQPVVPVIARDGFAYAERDDDGPWGLADFGNDHLTAVRAPFNEYEGGWKRHRCSRRAEVKDLTTIHDVYAEQDKAPGLQFSVRQVGGDVSVGDRLTVFDDRGAEVRAEVRRVVAEVVPDWSTYTTRLEREQPRLGEMS